MEILCSEGEDENGENLPRQHREPALAREGVTACAQHQDRPAHSQ